MFVEPIRLFIRESVSLKGCHLGCHASQGIWRPECANVLQLRGENRQPLFHFLTSPEIELEEEPRYLCARCIFSQSRHFVRMVFEVEHNWLTLLLAQSHFICIVPIIQAKHPPYPTLYRGQTEPNKDIKSSNNKHIHVSTFTL